MAISRDEFQSAATYDQWKAAWTRNQFWELAAQRRVAAICLTSVEAANRIFEGVSPPRLDVAPDEPSSAFLDRHRRYSAVIAGDLAALPGWRARFKRLRQLAFPPRSFMMQSFGAPWRVLLPLERRRKRNWNPPSSA